MTLLQTERLTLRNWRDDDLDVFHRLNSDETVMKYFPFRRSKKEAAEVMENIINKVDENGYGWTAVSLKNNDQIIGITGISEFTADVPFTPATEIGWRLLPEFWGKGYATEAAIAWLDFAFKTLRLNQVIAFAVPINPGSTAVMERIGMRHYPEKDFDHPNVSDDYSHLKRHVYYAIARDEFLSRNA